MSKTVDGRPEYPGELTLVEIELLTGRHHQIRVQFAGHGLPLYGDRRYNPGTSGDELALCACGLTFRHPVTGREMTFSMEPEGRIFEKFHSR